MGSNNKGISPEKKTSEEKEVCGIIMPISGSDNYTAEHWSDVKSVLQEVEPGLAFSINDI